MDLFVFPERLIIKSPSSLVHIFSHTVHHLRYSWLTMQKLRQFGKELDSAGGSVIIATESLSLDFQDKTD